MVLLLGEVAIFHGYGGDAHLAKAGLERSDSSEVGGFELGDGIGEGVHEFAEIQDAEVWACGDGAFSQGEEAAQVIADAQQDLAIGGTITEVGRCAIG